MPKKKVVVRKVVSDPTEGLEKKKILLARRHKIRRFLRKQSLRTGRTVADLISQSLTKDEAARAIALILERVSPTDLSGSIFPPPEAVEVKEEPQSSQVLSSSKEDVNCVFQHLKYTFKLRRTRMRMLKLLPR